MKSFHHDFLIKQARLFGFELEVHGSGTENNKNEMSIGLFELYEMEGRKKWIYASFENLLDLLEFFKMLHKMTTMGESEEVRSARLSYETLKKLTCDEN